MTKPLNVPIFYDESLGPKTKNCKFTFLLKCKIWCVYVVWWIYVVA